MGKIIISPSRLQVDGPLIFLAGPIQGAPDWQSDAIALLGKMTDAHIASPRRSTLTVDDFGEDMYNEQVDWEHDYLDRAAKNGAIMFWLAKEAQHRCDRAYAQTSRFELGETVTLHRLKGVKIAVGIEKGFSGARYFIKTIGKKAPDIPICATLRETCEKTAELLILT